MDQQFFDDIYLERALQLALQGLGRTSPNPIVGAVVELKHQILGEGFHARAGEPHAEILALQKAGEKARGATLYVTLEPCNHQGRTPPCCDRIIEAGVARVVVGVTDPDPRVRGTGIQRLREAGIQVDMASFDLAERCATNTRFFLTRVLLGRPFVTVKFASTLDGKLATRTGQSKWISGAEARHWVHQQRATYDAVMVGIGTALKDDPELSPREPAGRIPVKVVADSQGRLPADARLLQEAPAGVIVLTTPSGAERLASLPVECVVAPAADGLVDLRVAFKLLAERGLNSVLVEGGSELNGNLLDLDLVDQVAAFIAPKLIGGATAPGPFGGRGRGRLELAKMLKNQGWRQLGEDLFIEGYLRTPWEDLLPDES